VPRSAREPAASPAGGFFDAVVFDLDGVIVDTERIIHQVWGEVFARYESSFTPAEWAAIVGTDKGFDPYAALVERSRLPVPLRDELREQVDKREQVLLAGLGPLPGVREWVEGAERLGLGIAVASSSPAEWVTGRLADVGLEGHFAVVSGRNEKLAAKPAPDVYLDACRRLGAEPARAIAVEDSANGLAAAKSAGLTCVAVPNTVTRDHDLGAADLLLDSLASMPLEEAVRLLSEKRAGQRPAGRSG